MTKILSSSAYNALKAKADNYDVVVNSVVARNEDLKPEDVTPEVIEDAINAEPETVEVENTERVTELESEVKTLTEEVETLKVQNKELSELPGAQSITDGKPASEVTTVESDDLMDFCNANKGNTLAIAAKMKESGIV